METSYFSRPLAADLISVGQPAVGGPAMSMARPRLIDPVTTAFHATGLSGAVAGAFGTRDDAKGLSPRGAPV